MPCFTGNNAIKQITDAFGRRLEKSGVTRIQWIAMIFLNESGGLSQRELALRMNNKDSTIARLLDRMERDKLVHRHKSDADRRISTVMLTEKGHRIWQELKPVVERFSEQTMRGISPEDLEAYDRVLKKMVDNALRDTPEDNK